MSVSLRPYQSDLIGQVRALMLSGTRTILLQAPTGAGKTLLTAHMLHTAASKGMASFFVVHRRELIKQSNRAFALEGLRHGIIAAGFQEDHRPLVQIASIQTLAKRFARFRTPSLVVWDECHHIAAGSWARIFAALPRAYHIGLTATPERLDGSGLDKYFQAMVKGPAVSWLIENGYLSPYKLFAPTQINMAGVHTRMGDYVISELNQAVDKPAITGDAVAHYRRHCDGKRAVVFCASVSHSEHVRDSFQKAGIPAAHVDGSTDPAERDACIRRFASGEIKILTNCELFSEGFDLPAIEAAILLRPTQSLGLYLQQVGRALRPCPGKEAAIILDHVGNCQRHGLPDEDRTWSLAGRATGKGGNQENSKSVKVCPRCFAAQFAGLAACKFCGYVFVVNAREIDEKEGELAEVDKEAIRRQRMREQSTADDRTALLALAKQRGYRNPNGWVHHILQARQAKKLRMGRVA